MNLKRQHTQSAIVREWHTYLQEEYTNKTLRTCVVVRI